MRDRRPIGVFDSGIGGLTVLSALCCHLPEERFVYLGDTARLPYGTKSGETVTRYALRAAQFLAGEEIKMLVIACNSASSAVLRDARERYDVPVVEVILPAARRAVKVSKSGRIGVICTEATANSQSYDDALAAVPGVHLFTQACPLFVDYVERGITGGPELLAVAQGYLAGLKGEGIDTLILGCTHYPLLAGVISYVLGDEITLVSAAEECAKEVFHTLTDLDLVHGESRKASRRFLTTGNPDKFEGIGRRLMGGFVVDVEQIVAVSAL